VSAPAAAPTRCIHDIFPAASCSLCHPQLEQDTGPALEPYATVEAFHRTWCRSCEGWVEQGEQVGFVRGVGVCCADCCRIGGDWCVLR
jgi:hypothetical protein